MLRPIRWSDPWRCEVLDQTRLPFEEVWVRLDSAVACRAAISRMQVRGAPLIGAVGAFGLAFALREKPDDAALAESIRRMVSSRPTAVNLAWAVERVARLVRGRPMAERATAAWAEAVCIAEEDARGNATIGEHGAALLTPLKQPERPLRILTHCNAGWLATAGHGTALAPVYALHAAGVPVHVWVDETRPRNQGALTAWELGRAGVPHTVIADNAGGVLMMCGEVDVVIVGADRVAANGDVANKVGTYLKALAARANGIPCYVACPISTLDPSTRDGGAIVIEERHADEVTYVVGQADGGPVTRVRVVPEGSAVLNPAFDITPADLVTALITERGIVAATPAGIAAAVGGRR